MPSDAYAHYGQEDQAEKEVVETQADKAAQPAAASLAASEQPDPSVALVDRWWSDHFPGSIVARNTEVWNFVHAAKERLKELLASRP